nr:hypothetical protein [Salinispora arenicola]
MSQTRTTDTRPPAPVALLLRPTHTHRPADAAGRPLPDWYGIHPDHLALLIARYTRDGDTVLDTDAHPTVAAAAEHLHRRPGTAVTDGETPYVWPERSTAGRRPPPGTAPGWSWRPCRAWTSTAATPHAIGSALGAWQALLRPGGFLVLLMTAGPGSGAGGHRSAVIAAARTAGLLYHQHIPVLLVPLSETEPRTEPAVALHPPLLAGRHVPAHRDLLAFVSITPEAADV